MLRRDFLLATAATAVAASASRTPPVCLFSKHLQDLDYGDLAKALRDLGFDGADLTVRPGGHVLPERVAADLPRAVDIIRNAGITVPMITTGLISVNDPAARPTLETAGRLKIPYFKTGYWRYKDGDVEQILAEATRDARPLVELARSHGVRTGFHNHSGDYVGTAVWDTRRMIEGLPPEWAGYYYDPCHATIEGGAAGWRVAFQMASKRLMMVAVKDFYWEKLQGRWRTRTCPLGEGMVDWPRFFSLLAAARFQGPISLHVEYRPENDREAFARDLAFVRRHLKQAYGG